MDNETMKTATKLRENRFDTFVAKISVFNNNWKFGLPTTNVAPLFMKKTTPKTIKKRHRNHTLFFQELNDTVWILTKIE